MVCDMFAACLPSFFVIFTEHGSVFGVCLPRRFDGSCDKPGYGLPAFPPAPRGWQLLYY